MHKVGRCWGLVLWAGAKKHLEVWFCLEGVKEHVHPNQVVEVMPVYGWGYFRRYKSAGAVQSVQVKPRTWFRCFTIPAGWPHWFTLDRGPMIFFNLTFDGRSAAENIIG